MRLLLDIGNTRVKWFCQDAEYSQSFFDESVIHEGEFFKALTKVRQSLLEKKIQREVSEVCIGSVVAGKEDLMRAVQFVWNLTPMFVSVSKEAGGVINSYAEPVSMGVDRWAAIVEAFSMVESGVCVFDLGSALTIDVVNISGLHLGGYILPGMKMMSDSLLKNTSGVYVNQINFHKAEPVLGNSTTSAVNNGVLFTAITLIESSIRGFAKKFDFPVEFFLTGGGAPLILPFIGESVRYEADLVLRGLGRLVESEY
jgi:type III pantothenate kinase